MASVYRGLIRHVILHTFVGKHIGVDDVLAGTVNFHVTVTNVVGEQVFYVDDCKGWGIRTLERLSPGCFVFEYVGEVVTNAELLTRGVGDKYSLALDAHWQSELNLGDESLLAIDASVYSNVARWLNHRYVDIIHISDPIIF